MIPHQPAQPLQGPDVAHIHRTQAGAEFRRDLRERELVFIAEHEDLSVGFVQA
jgi:hypothetical protein